MTVTALPFFLLVTLTLEPKGSDLWAAKSPNVRGDDRAALLLPDPLGLAIQVEEPT
jgi:hypothetical protein